MSVSSEKTSGTYQHRCGCRGTGAGQKDILATYEKIKAYVLEHSGLKVSSLYIAQVEQKCGIIERANYNKPKPEAARQPQCPPEKKKAIMEALNHFGMI